jgi:hypothetical protein
VEDDAKGVPLPRPETAYAMAEIDTIGAPRSLDRTMMHCESHSVALAERDHLGPRLHTRPLLGQHEFASGEIFLGLREQDRHLYWKNVFTVEILMQAVEVTHSIPKEQGRWSLLPRVMTLLYEVLVALRVANVDPHGGIPTIRDRRKPSIERGAKTLNKFGQRIVEVLVLSASESVPCHDNATAEDQFPLIQRDECQALSRKENAGKQTTSLLIQFRANLRPIEFVDPGNRIFRYGIDGVSVASNYLVLEKKVHHRGSLVNHPHLGHSYLIYRDAAKTALRFLLLNSRVADSLACAKSRLPRQVQIGPCV